MFKKSPFLKGENGKQKELYKVLFVTAFFGMLVCFIPSMIANKGIFLYYGDFNSQQMMFYKHAQQLVKEGNMNWDWGTDLGTPFVSSYSFYLLGSPFFWLTTLFPVGSTVYLMPWLLSLKTAVAAVCAYAYIRRFVKTPHSAFIGAMLYAFSGFQTYNVFFNHFHDATAFFPLMLLGFEMLVQDNKKGAFALSVAISGCISYFFLVCEAVFIVIYFFLRCIDKEFMIDMKKFIMLIAEAVLGGLMAAIILLPSVITVLLNYRVTERLYGLDLVIYNDKTRIWRIFQAFFMVSDLPARINIFGASDSARWASLAGYMPMFAMAGVIAYMRTRKRDWLHWSVIVFGVMACIPVLNSTFVLFNASYYARWYYMPILLFALMTAQVVDEDRNDLKKGFVPSLAVGMLFLGIGMLPQHHETKDELGRVIKTETTYGKLPKYETKDYNFLYSKQAILTIIMYAMLFVLIYYVTDKKRKQMKFKKIACVMTACACVITNTTMVLYGVEQGPDNKEYIEMAINGGDKIDMDKLEAASQYYVEDNTFYRIDTSPDVDNWCMFWDLSSMRTFHSVVASSIMDFYTELGQTRDVASRMEKNLYPLRALLSVKYYFNRLPEKQRTGENEIKTPDHISDLEDFHYVDTQNKFNIYENENYIPMGFAYDYYITDDDIKREEDEVNKTHMLLKALVLDKEQAKKYKDVLDYTTFSSSDFTVEAFENNVAARRAESCYSFSYSTDGFDAKIQLESPKLVFFSVPYDDGWSAKVNGKTVDIEKVDYGLMAVLVPAGDSSISFTYKAPGSTLGVVGTAVGIVVFIGYLLYWYKFAPVDPEEERKRRKAQEKSSGKDGENEDEEAEEIKEKPKKKKKKPEPADEEPEEDIYSGEYDDEEDEPIDLSKELRELEKENGAAQTDSLEKAKKQAEKLIEKELSDKDKKN